MQWSTHARTTFTVAATVDTDTLRAEVTDHSTSPPSLRAPMTDEITGRGLLIVSTTAAPQEECPKRASSVGGGECRSVRSRRLYQLTKLPTSSRCGGIPGHHGSTLGLGFVTEKKTTRYATARLRGEGSAG